jgi:exosortase D (VPLPA-CTERM-specific)
MKNIHVSSMQKMNWSLVLSLVVLLGAFCFQYYPDFGNMLIRWNHEDFSYCYLVPLVFIYLIYTNRKSLANYQPRSSPLGLGVIFLSGVFYLMGKLGSIETLVYIAIWMVVVGLTILIMGTKITRAMAFPLLILAFIVPLPPFLNRLFTFKLKLLSSSLSVKMMQLGGFSVHQEGNIIDLGIKQLQVVDACSGLRYVYPLLLMGLLLGYMFQRRFWKRAVMVLATIPVSVFSNALRIAITGFLTLKVSATAADTFFHGFSGWLIFMVSFLFLIILSGLLKIIQPSSNPQEAKDKKEDSLPSNALDLRKVRQSYLWMATGLFLVFWSLNTAFASAQIKPSRLAFDSFPTAIGEWQGKRSYVRPEILEELWADDYIQIEFSHSKTRDVLLLFIPYYEHQGTRHTAHSPVSCLMGGGYALRSRKIIEKRFPEPFGKVKIRQMVLEQSKNLLLSNYWFQQRGRIVVSEYANKWYLFWDSLTKGRTDGALVRIEMPLRHRQDLQEAQALIDSFTQELLKILPEYLPV